MALILSNVSQKREAGEKQKQMRKMMNRKKEAKSPQNVAGCLPYYLQLTT
jgi:hypothetical protein